MWVAMAWFIVLAPDSSGASVKVYGLAVVWLVSWDPSSPVDGDATVGSLLLVVLAVGAVNVTGTVVGRVKNGPSVAE